MSDTPENASGGATSAIDLKTEADRGMVRKAMERWPKRWRGIDDARKDGFVAGLVEANDAARKLLATPDADMSLKAAAAVASIVRTAAMMEGQNQTDEHLEDKNARLDDGKATERIDGVIMEVLGPRRTET